MKNLNIILFFLTTFTIGFTSCDKEKDDIDDIVNGDVNPIENLSAERYLISDLNGELFTYVIRTENNGFIALNERDGSTVEGSITDNSAAGKFDKTISYQGVTFPALQISKEILISGMGQMSIGLSSDQHFENNFDKSNFAGRYLWMTFDKQDFQFGGMTVNSDETYKYDIVPEDSPMESLNEQNIFAGNQSGEWRSSPIDTGRLTFKQDGADYITAALPGKAFVINNGKDAGFTFAMAYPSSKIDMAAAAGRYRFFMTMGDGATYGTGTFIIPSSGNQIDYSARIIEATGESNNITDKIFDFAPLPELNNIFIGKNIADGDTISTSFFVLPNEYITFVSWTEEEGIISRGIGLKE